MNTKMKRRMMTEEQIRRGKEDASDIACCKNVEQRVLMAHREKLVLKK